MCTFLLTNPNKYGNSLHFNHDKKRLQNCSVFVANSRNFIHLKWGVILSIQRRLKAWKHMTITLLQDRVEKGSENGRSWSDDSEVKQWLEVVRDNDRALLGTSNHWEQRAWDAAYDSPVWWAIRHKKKTELTRLRSKAQIKVATPKSWVHFIKSNLQEKFYFQTQISRFTHAPLKSMWNRPACGRYIGSGTGIWAGFFIMYRIECSTFFGSYVDVFHQKFKLPSSQEVSYFF